MYRSAKQCNKEKSIFHAYKYDKRQKNKDKNRYEIFRKFYIFVLISIDKN